MTGQQDTEKHAYCHDATMNGQRGVALLLVIWAIILLGGLVGGLLATGSGEVRLARNLIAIEKAQNLADAGINRAILLLLSSDDLAEIELGDATGFGLRFDDAAEITVTIRDSCGQIDLNWAPEPLLSAYALAAGLSPASARQFSAAVIAGRGAADAASGDATANSFSPPSARPPVAASGGIPAAPWQTRRDIARLAGINRQELAALLPGLTVNCREQGADPEFAGAAVSRAIALTGLSGRSHRLAYDITAEVKLPDGATAATEAALWLTRDSRQPYRIVHWYRR